MSATSMASCLIVFVFFMMWFLSLARLISDGRVSFSVNRLARPERASQTNADSPAKSGQKRKEGNPEHYFVGGTGRSNSPSFCFHVQTVQRGRWPRKVPPVPA